MIPKVIFFDLDDTLLYEVATDSAVIVDVVRRLVPALDVTAATLVQAVHTAARALWRESPAIDWCRRIGTSSIEGLYGDYSGNDPRLAEVHRYIHQENYRERVWSGALQSLGLPDTKDLARELAGAYSTERPRRHVPVPGAGITLEWLAQGFRMVLLTNGAPRIQRGKLAGSGFAPRFEAVIVSGEVGVGKPDPAIFHDALKLAGVSAEEAVMVGNSLSNDVIGAQNVGINAIWFNLDDETIPATVQPWRTVTTLPEIPSLLGRPLIPR